MGLEQVTEGPGSSGSVKTGTSQTAAHPGLAWLWVWLDLQTTAWLSFFLDGTFAAGVHPVSPVSQGESSSSFPGLALRFPARHTPDQSLSACRVVCVCLSTAPGLLLPSIFRGAPKHNS